MTDTERYAAGLERIGATPRPMLEGWCATHDTDYWRCDLARMDENCLIYFGPDCVLATALGGSIPESETA